VDAYVVKGPQAPMLENLRKALDGIRGRRGASTPAPLQFIPDGFAPRRIVGYLIRDKLRREQLLEAVPGGIAVTDEAGRIVYVNRAAVRMLEREELELIGSSFGETFEAKNRQKVQRLLMPLLQGRGVRSRTLLMSTGKKVIRLHFDRLLAPPETLGAVIGLEDLTFLKNTEEFHLDSGRDLSDFV
jgi:PAS domain S-box-containing protein